MLDHWYSKPQILLGGRRVSQVLRATYDFLLAQGQYCQGAPALSETSDTVKPTDDAAVCWSLDGALSKNCNQLGLVPPELFKYLDHMVLWYVDARKLFTINTAESAHFHPFTYFADTAHGEHVLEFLLFASIHAELEGF